MTVFGPNLVEFGPELAEFGQLSTPPGRLGPNVVDPRPKLLEAAPKPDEVGLVFTDPEPNVVEFGRYGAEIRRSQGEIGWGRPRINRHRPEFSWPAVDGIRSVSAPSASNSIGVPPKLGDSTGPDRFVEATACTQRSGTALVPERD